MPQISIVTNVYNAESTLNDYLDSLTNQSIKGFELIIIDDGSVDRTVEIAERYQVCLNIHITRLPHIGLRAARVVGVEKAKGDFIIILDADEIVPPDCVEQLIQPFADSKVGAVGARLVPMGEGWVIEGTKLLRDLKHQLRKDRHGNALVLMGGCLAVRKTAVESVGGFTSEKQVAEDHNISRNLRDNGWKLVALDSLDILHRDPTTLSGIFRRQFKVGQRIVPTVKDGGTTLPLLKLGAPIIYVVGLLGAIALFFVKWWVGLLAISMIYLVVMVVFRKLNYTKTQKIFAWAVLTTDSLGYTAGFISSLANFSFLKIKGVN